VSQSRQDFLDARFRANGLADLFPDGLPGVIANALTNDRTPARLAHAAETSGAPSLNKTVIRSTPTRPSTGASMAGQLVADDRPRALLPLGGRNVSRLRRGPARAQAQLPGKV